VFLNVQFGKRIFACYSLSSLIKTFAVFLTVQFGKRTFAVLPTVQFGKSTVSDRGERTNLCKREDILSFDYAV